MDFADTHPEAEVIGNDLSPIQPTWVPPNCTFVIDDFEREWASFQTFNYIHGREMEGSVLDYDLLFARAYKQLKPGGYLEMQNLVMEFFSDDNTLGKAYSLLTWRRLGLEAAKKAGKEMYTSRTWEEKMKQAGFKNVKVNLYKLPLGSWPKDDKFKELGRYQRAQLLEGLKSYTPGLFIDVLDWTAEEAEVLMALARNDIANRAIHLYTKVLFLYGQKVEA